MSEAVLSAHAFWLILGALLVLSEFVIPGVVAVFFGFGALLVGLTTWLGWTDTLASQLWTFGLASLAVLFGLRRHFHRWMRGNVEQRGDGSEADASQVGQPVTVLEPFRQGQGVVSLRGARWTAEADEDFQVGERLQVVAQRGIVLRVAR